MSTLADTGAGSLRAALATPLTGDTVAFAPALAGTLTLASPLPTITVSLTVTGPGADKVRVLNAAGRVFDLQNAGAVTLNGLSLSGSGLDLGENGGAIRSQGATQLTLDGVAIARSTVTKQWNGGGLGGGVYSGAGSSLSVRASTFEANRADKGGAIYAVGAGLTMVNSTLTQNQADDSGGAISLEFGPASTITQSTLTANSAAIGGGVYVRNTASLNLVNSVLAGNTDRGGANDVDHGNNTVSATGSLFSETDATSVVHNGADSNNLYGADPLLGALASNGGTTQTQLPGAGSPALNAVACTGVALDQRGIARPQGVLCDIGAVEVAAPPAAVPTLSSAAWALLAFVLVGVFAWRRGRIGTS
ncbi:hypothetical protein FVQ98_07575 [Ottowia sp. GY511]|uniref:choice-of-anchor Q domain-containing protein n=1 Tax=Ottowia sp. GY511 TaxID=2603274 RepID=UPI0011D8EC83|nr:choice-of-anchor Q domain-containing protein [Ottowia sp. GY511]TXK29740.1 hypothetical protein FVQ98_07575 [Ottowia sp. GY511]